MYTQSSTKKVMVHCVFSTRFVFLASCDGGAVCVGGWCVPRTLFILALAYAVMIVYTFTRGQVEPVSLPPGLVHCSPPEMLWFCSMSGLRFYGSILDCCLRFRMAHVTYSHSWPGCCRSWVGLVMSTPLPKSHTSKPFWELSKTVKTSLSLLKCFGFGFTGSHWKCRKSTSHKAKTVLSCGLWLCEIPSLIYVGLPQLHPHNLSPLYGAPYKSPFEILLEEQHMWP